MIMLDDLSKTATVATGQRTIRIARTSIWTGILLSISLMLSRIPYGYVPAVAGALLHELVDLATILIALRARRDGRSRLGPATISTVPVPRQVQSGGHGSGLERSPHRCICGSESMA